MQALNQESPIPLYRQLADRLLADIRSGRHPEGARIPSEHELARTFGIGRPTVRQATDRLVRNGVLVRRRGAGTFVRSAPTAVDLFSLAGTIAAFRDKGISVTPRILINTRLKPVRGDAENPFSGERAYFLSRLSTVENTPVLIEEMYLDPVLFEGIDRVDMTGRSLSQIVQERYYLRPVGGRQTFRIGTASGKRAKLLGVPPDQPILLVKRYLDFQGAGNAVYAELFCRTDRFIFSQILGGRSHEASRIL